MVVSYQFSVVSTQQSAIGFRQRSTEVGREEQGLTDIGSW